MKPQDRGVPDLPPNAALCGVNVRTKESSFQSGDRSFLEQKSILNKRRRELHLLQSYQELVWNSLQ